MSAFGNLESSSLGASFKTSLSIKLSSGNLVPKKTGKGKKKTLATPSQSDIPSLKDQLKQDASQNVSPVPGLKELLRKNNTPSHEPQKQPSLDRSGATSLAAETSKQTMEQKKDVFDMDQAQTAERVLHLLFPQDEKQPFVSH